MFSLLVTAHLLVLLCLPQGQADDLIISLKEPNSKIRGHILKSHLGRNYYGFQEIPYAVPPVGENRFAEPKRHPGWSGVLNTTQSTKICTQSGRVTTEDCLVLNVYAPVNNSTAKLPVMVWIHGGAFITGSGTYEEVNPQYFIDYNIIVVVINYRVGAFGFLTTEDGIIPGNIGLKDQLLALKWVNKNIEAFGGDPNKVTIAGQSAGSISVSFHLVSEKSTGLYRGAIMESGSALCHGSYIAHARNYSFQLGRLLDKNFTSDDSKELLKVLRKASAQDILSASLRVQKVGNQVGILEDLIWAVVIEDKNRNNSFITDPMHEAFKNGSFEKVPVMIGYTSEETMSFMGSAESIKISAAEHDESPANLISFKWNVAVKNESIAGAELKKLYVNSTFGQNLASFISFSSDIGFVNPIIHEAYLSSKYVPVYLYEFSYKGTKHHDPTNIPNLQGVGHAEELYYMWLWLSQSKADVLTSHRLLTMWTNFIKQLNPTPTVNPDLGIPIWQSVEKDNLVYMDIGSSLVLKKNPKKYLDVKTIFSQYLEPPYNVY